MYNTRIGQKKNGLQVDRDPIDWDVYADEMKEFKLKYIYDKLRLDELETHV
jgi:tRNA pseudouridine38-40 synthase